MKAIYPAGLLFLKLSWISNVTFFIALGVLDFSTRVGLGIYFCMNWSAFASFDVIRTEPLAMPEERSRLLHQGS
jgi:hypothetical protein